MATFIHTADLHLGRQLYGERLLEDQRVVLDQLAALVEERRPTALLIAGDVYDRSVPPAEAVELLDDLVVRIAGELETPVVMIPGNHDNNAEKSHLESGADLNMIIFLSKPHRPVVCQSS